jgi:ubiquinone biosynthesis protein COQ9
MTEKKKVAARKPTPRKAKAKKPETENPKAKKMHQTRPDDEAKKQAVLAAALPQAAFDGFTDAVLEKAGAEADVSKADMARLFEGGPLSLVEYFSHWADGQMEKTLAGLNLPGM